MTHTFKPGDFAMVEIARIDKTLAAVVLPDKRTDLIFVEALRPLPPSMTPEPEAVLEAADKWEASRDVSDEMRLIHAVRAWRASRKPPGPLGPVAELIAYLRLTKISSLNADLGRKIDAVEAMLKGREE